MVLHHFDECYRRKVQGTSQVALKDFHLISFIYSLMYSIVTIYVIFSD